MKLKKFIFKHRYLFLIILVVAIPLSILADLTFQSYNLNKNNSLAIRTRQSDNTSLSNSAICTMNTSNVDYFVPNKTWTEINSFLTHLPSGVAVGSGCCVDGICDSAAGESCGNCFADCSANCCSGSFTDSRDGKSYPMVKVGDQCWMGKNLDVGTMKNAPNNQTNNGVIEKHCYNNTSSNCTIYGGLYQWGEAVNYINGASNTTVFNPVPTGRDTSITFYLEPLGNIQGICPTGWHLPKYKEVLALRNYFGGTYTTGGKLKEVGTAHWTSPNVVAATTTSFNALGAGRIFAVRNAFEELNIRTVFWGSGVGDNGYTPGTYMYDLSVDGFYLMNNDSNFVMNGMSTFYRTSASGVNPPTYNYYSNSVRCIKDGGGGVSYNLAYSAVNGSITGYSLQNIEGGASGQQVTVVCNSGYRFANWSDGSTTNPRTDANVQSNKTLIANCVPMVCGDGSCNGAETCVSCSTDCGICPYCADGYCNGHESCGNWNDPVQDSAHYSACYSDCSYCSCYSDDDCIAGGGYCSGYTDPSCNGYYLEQYDQNWYNCNGAFNNEQDCTYNGCTWDTGSSGYCI